VVEQLQLATASLVYFVEVAVLASQRHVTATLASAQPAPLASSARAVTARARGLALLVQMHHPEAIIHPMA
jgi:hypothetical protein